MKVFLDFEASSLSDRSYPIEVAWVFQDGRSETHVIAPAPSWEDWGAASEAIHGIERAAPVAEGEPHDVVAEAISWAGRRPARRSALRRMRSSNPANPPRWTSKVANTIPVETTSCMRTLMGSRYPVPKVSPLRIRRSPAAWSA